MNHDDRELEFIRKQLSSALPPSSDSELQVDLWPRMLRRLEEPPVTFGWFEAVLAGLIVIAFAIRPDLLAAMLYHL
ncbi:MAG TPA: hypothetical protein VGZ73_04205 [Bryobacteraceae bacterium]|jgi:hypothetical protein|nr:hypothetical protein [Bryobacteraceae bacterium]